MFKILAAILIAWGSFDVFSGIYNYPFWAGRSHCDAVCNLQVIQCELIMIKGFVVLILAKIVWK